MSWCQNFLFQLIHGLILSLSSLLLGLDMPDTGLGAPDLRWLSFTQKQLKVLDLLNDIYTFKFGFRLQYFCFLYILALIGQIS